MIFFISQACVQQARSYHFGMEDVSAFLPLITLISWFSTPRWRQITRTERTHAAIVQD